MNKRGRKTNGLSHRLIALLLCCVCLITVLPLSAIALAPDETAAAAEEIAPEEPAVDIAEEPETPAAEEPTTEPVTEEPADTDADAEEPEIPDAAEPDTEPDAEPEEDSAEQRAVDALYRYLMACTSYEEMDAAINALSEDELYLMNQFTDEQNAALEAKMQELGGYASDVYADQTRQQECKIAQGDEYNVTVNGTLTDSISYNFVDSDGNQITVDGITAEFESSNTSSYKIKVEDSVPVGTYIMIVNYTTKSGYIWSKTTEYKDTVTITVTKPGEEDAEIYYLKSPTSNPKSNSSDEWGLKIGVGTVNTTGATWEPDIDAATKTDKNIFKDVSTYVVALASDMVNQNDGSWLIPKDKYSTHYQAIFKTYKEEWEKNYPGDLELKLEDIEAIYLTPFKISKDNGTDPDKHIDCKVSVKTGKTFVALFHVTLPDGTENQVDSKYYKLDDLVAKTEEAPTGTTGTYTDTKVVDGITYKFVGWYNEANELISDDDWSYKPNDAELADGTVNFYAKYVPVTANLTITKTLSGNMYNENDKFKFTVTYDGEEQKITLGNNDSKIISIPVGAEVTISENPDGYKSSLAESTLADLSSDKWQNDSITFTMPTDNVSVVINNDKTITIDAGVVVSTLPYVLMLAVVVGGVTVTVTRRKHRRND